MFYKRLGSRYQQDEEVSKALMVIIRGWLLVGSQRGQNEVGSFVLQQVKLQGGFEETYMITVLVLLLTLCLRSNNFISLQFFFPSCLPCLLYWTVYCLG